MLDLAIAVSDRPVAPDQYRYIETHAWWLGTFGSHQHLTEHRVRQWVPAHAGRDWVLDRELTGAQTWLAGSAAQARADGFDLHDVVPVGRFRAPHGEFDRDHPGGGCARPRPARRGSWHSPTVDFLERLPRDPVVLLGRLREDNPGTWFSPFAAAVTALRTGLAPAELRRALYRAVTGLPEVHVTERVRNIDGHECLALVHDAGRTRTELMVDRERGEFAGERDALRGDSRCGLPTGTVISTTAVRTAVVDREGALP